MGNEIKELEQRIIDLLEQLSIAARGFVRELVYERGAKVTGHER